MPALDLNSSLKLNTDLPLALFPVRLETRFKDGELLVRIYPDTVHVDSFEPELTEIEVTWGKSFWIHTWLAGKDEAREKSPWAQLAEQFGAARAAWIARQLEPKNPGDQPKKPIDVTDKKLPPESYLPIQPQFPSPATHSQAWTRAPYTQILPNNWIALLYENEESTPLIFEGNAIKLPLDVGISPEKGKGLDANTLKDNDKIGWLVDFAKAEAAGMGLRIPNPPRNIKRLLVMGVNTALSGGKGQEQLEALIRAHHHTQGISFLLQGTPTNNTEDAPSGYSTQDPGFENSFRIERKADPTLVEHSNRAVTAKALGVNDSIFVHVGEASTVEQRDAQNMNSALWQATWGYFLEQMMAGPNAPSEQTLRQARSHFEQYVRARGPLPAIRIGTQPYGLLPVISLDQFELLKKKDDQSLDAQLMSFLQKLRAVWRNSLPLVPRASGDFNELTDKLNITPVSVGYHRRPMQRIALRSSPPSPGADDSGNQTARQKAQDFGLAWTPRQIRMVYGSYLRGSKWPGNIITPSEGKGEDYRTYCQGLIEKSYAEIEQRTLSSKSDSLFYWLLREACLREYLVAACRILKLPPEKRVEFEYEEGDISTLGQVLENSVANLNPPKIGDYLDNIKKQLASKTVNFEITRIQGVPTVIAAELHEFAAFFKSLNYLSRHSSDLLDGLFRETLDLCSHRYDAWVTSFATKRLEWLRNQPSKEKGIYLGGYGWVENLKSSSENNTAKNHGFIHAPSLAHATTAALLRSGYKSRDDVGDREALAINLSSERIRNALWLLDGVRQGQSLAALLGYRFERGLHENHPGMILDAYIPFFRKIAPLDIQALSAMSKEAISAQPASQVVDGLELLHKWQNAWGRDIKNIPWSKSSITPPESHQKACEDEMKRLEDAVDAIGDLVIAESVHQVAQGNPVRAGATLAAIAEGEAPPPELDVIRTPRTGIGITHRIAVVFTGLPKGPAWGSQTARALAEPYLNAWAARIFGPMAPHAGCQVEYFETDPNDKTKKVLLDQRIITLDQLGLAPIDLLYLPESEGDAQRSEVEQRVIYLAQRSLPDKVTSAAEIWLSFTRDHDSPDGAMSFAEVLEVARVARRMITSSRALAPRDLALPDLSIPPDAEIDTVRSGESADAPLALGERAALTIKAFNQACTDFFKIFLADSTASFDFEAVRLRLVQLDALVAALQEDSTEKIIDCEVVRVRMMHLSTYGLPSAIPLAPIGNTTKVQRILLSQVQSTLDEIIKRNDRIQSLTESYANLKPEERSSPTVLREYHVARLREIFGQEFCVLPRFNPINTADLRSTFAASNTLQGDDPLESVTWFQRVARVREGAARLDAALMYAEAMGESKLSFTVGQLPYTLNDRWAALAGDLPGSRLSLVVHAPAGLDLTTNPIAGLLIDEWVEVVPSKEEITGVAFHYDAPQSRAPQAILLAVAPDDRPEWNLRMLADTLNETLELAKLRAVDLTRLIHPEVIEPIPSKPKKVDPNLLTEFGQFLPALYFPPARAPEWEEKTS